MKRVTIRTGLRHSSRDVFHTVLEHSPQRALDVGEIRKRVKVLDLIDAAQGDSVVLEDADHGTLKGALEGFPWQVAHRELLSVIDDVLEAKNVSTAQLNVVEDEGRDAAE